MKILGYVREIHLTTVLYPNLPQDWELHGCSPMKPDKLEHLGIFFWD